MWINPNPVNPTVEAAKGFHDLDDNIVLPMKNYCPLQVLEGQDENSEHRKREPNKQGRGR